jgi:hypothetical protein
VYVTTTISAIAGNDFRYAGTGRLDFVGAGTIRPQGFFTI